MSDIHDDDIWVFGYGSLMWRPGFPYQERGPARIRGYHRSLCVYSYVHRGTPQQPGLVLGLDRGGACRGIAFRVAASDATDVIAYLRAREQATMVYLEKHLTAHLPDGRRVRALGYVVDQRHEQYAGKLPVEEVLRLVRRGVGVSGANPEYVVSTYRHLEEMGVADALLAQISLALAAQAQDEDAAGRVA
jgi:glutathione-specific gamma-glutamylcyclotransferase